MKYVVFKNRDSQFLGFTTKTDFDKNPDVYFCEDDEISEEFEGPDYDGEDETFTKVKLLAMNLCVPRHLSFQKHIV